MNAQLKFSIHPNPAPVAADVRAGLLKDPGFGRVFTDHMVTIRWTQDGGWQDAQLRAREPIPLDPAAAVLHYGQEIFEGLKAYPGNDGSLYLRPFLFATEAFLGVRPSHDYLFVLIASSVGSYFKGGDKAVTV